MAIKDVLSTLVSQDGQFDDEIGAYVTAYPIDDDKLSVELEFYDQDNDIVDHVESYTITVQEA